MANMIGHLHPKLLWKHFDTIRRIPRPSRHEQRICEHVKNWADRRNLTCFQDKIGNLVIKVPPMEGFGDTPVVILQAHLDMVTEKKEDVEFDFLVDPIQVCVFNEYVAAKGTTLGADNGIGMAAAMALTDDKKAIHGPLELLFTVDEESGLSGAKQLDSMLIKGRLMINLDSEDEAIYIGCAGAAYTTGRFDIQRIPAARLTVPKRLSVGSLKGGHSGTLIHENSGNAIKFLARILHILRTQVKGLQVISLQGGSTRNTIPAQAEGLLRFTKAAWKEAKAKIDEMAAMLQKEYEQIESNLRVQLMQVSDNASFQKVWGKKQADRIINALIACPHGVVAMSRLVPGLVETSNNLALLRTEDREISISTLSRSSETLALNGVTEQVSAIIRLAGGREKVYNRYPGWKPNLNSMLLKRAINVFEVIHGDPPEVKAIHAGLECGIIGRRVQPF